MSTLNSTDLGAITECMDWEALDGKLKMKMMRPNRGKQPASNSVFMVLSPPEVFLKGIRDKSALDISPHSRFRNACDCCRDEVCRSFSCSLTVDIGQ